MTAACSVTALTGCILLTIMPLTVNDLLPGMLLLVSAYCSCINAAYLSSTIMLQSSAMLGDADFKNVSIVAHYIKERTKNAQFVIISLRNNMFELADRLVGIYKTNNATKSVAINPG